MIHLDQNHSPSIAPHAKSNLILNSNPHADQQQLLSWSSPARDDRSFYQEQQEIPPVSSLNTNPSIPTPDHSHPNTNPSAPKQALPSPPPLSSSSDLQKPQEPLPSSPTDARSPAIETSSSLSPPPDTTSPAFPTAPLANPDSSTLTASDQGEGPQGASKADELDKASRASTPLSELSSAPDNDDPPESTKPVIQPNANAPPLTDPPHSAPIRHMSEDSKRIPNPGSAMVNGHVDLSIVKAGSPLGSIHPGLPRHMSPAGPMRERSASLGISSISLNEASARSASVSGGPPRSDPKVVAILELNTLLLRVFMEFQARSIPPNDPRSQPYSQRLQSNLTWLAAAADEGRKVSLASIPLPLLQAPPPVEFAAMDRILRLYSELPNLFSKDIARRQAHSNHQMHPGQTPSPALKRDRPDDTSDLMNKRRDTGDTKITSAPVSSNSSPHQPPVLPTASISAPYNVGMHGVPSSNPSMPPPSVPSSMTLGPNEIAAAAQRTRQLQMRQALQQQQAHLNDASRQMSPPGSQQSGMQGTGIAGPSTAPQQQQQQLAALAAMGPAGLQAYQVLQNPSHPIVQYLHQNVPSFSSLPIQQQLQRVQMVATMHARNQQNRAAAMQSHGGNPSSNFAGGVPSISNPSLAGALQNGSPTRSSPISQQPNVASQSQQAGLFPNQGGSMDPRAALLASLTPQQQASLAAMNPQQRQLFLMQQQQALQRGNSASGMMNQQMLSQQRMAQAGSPTHNTPGMMGMGGVQSDGASFPALRSNPGVPGIARSIRTPSDHMQSPMTPQRGASQTPDDYQRAMMQQQQQGQRGMTPGQDGGFMGMGNAGMQGNAGWGSQGQQSVTGMGTGSYGMTPPNSAGVVGQGSPFVGGMPNGVSSPVVGSSWSQGAGFSTGSPVVGQQGQVQQHQQQMGAGGVDVVGPMRQTSMTPAPHTQMSQNSPVGDQTGMSDFDLFNWNQQ